MVVISRNKAEKLRALYKPQFIGKSSFFETAIFLYLRHNLQSSQKAIVNSFLSVLCSECIDQIADVLSSEKLLTLFVVTENLNECYYVFNGEIDHIND
jgi:hypothetical protein